MTVKQKSELLKGGGAHRRTESDYIGGDVQFRQSR